MEIMFLNYVFSFLKSEQLSDSTLYPLLLPCDYYWLYLIFNIDLGLVFHLTCFLRNLHTGQEATVRIRHGQRTVSKLGKEYVKAIYCHPAYLTYMQSTSYEIPDWIMHKLELRLPGEI